MRIEEGMAVDGVKGVAGDGVAVLEVGGVALAILCF